MSAKMYHDIYQFGSIEITVFANYESCACVVV